MINVMQNPAQHALTRTASSFYRAKKACVLARWTISLAGCCFSEEFSFPGCVDNGLVDLFIDVEEALTGLEHECREELDRLGACLLIFERDRDAADRRAALGIDEHDALEILILPAELAEQEGRGLAPSWCFPEGASIRAS